MNVMSDANHGDGGEQGLEFLSSSRFVDEDGEVADGFFSAEGSDLIPIPLSSRMEPCRQQFTYADESSTKLKRGGSIKTGGALAKPSPQLSGENATQHSVFDPPHLFFYRLSSLYKRNHTVVWLTSVPSSKMSQ